MGLRVHGDDDVASFDFEHPLERLGVEDVVHHREDEPLAHVPLGAEDGEAVSALVTGI